VVTTLESVVPGFLSPQALFGFEIPGFRVALVLAVLLATGMFAANFLGRGILKYSEKVLGRIPLVRSIYQSVKQVSDTLLAPNGQAFRQAVLVQYPRAGSYTVALLTGAPSGEVADHLQGDYVSVYVPTTPNPTSGFFLIMMRSEVVPLNMSVDAALKYIVSMGVVAPPAGPILNAVDAAAQGVAVQVAAAQAQLSSVKSGSQTAPTQTTLSSEGVTTPVTPSRSSD
jgi:uncharacterized membrane protein